MKVLWFGTYSKGPGYPRNAVLMDALRLAGVEVEECHVPLFGGATDKVAAARSFTGRVRFGLRAAVAWATLTVRYLRAAPHDVVVVGYTGHIDLHLARPLTRLRRKPVVLDAFLSPWDTVVNDRSLLAPQSIGARLLYRIERRALRAADLVLTDTPIHAAFMARTFRVPKEKFLPLPVGSVLERTVEPGPEPFHAFFCGSFAPLQGVDYILDAAALAPDIPFRLVGDGPDAPRVVEEVSIRALPNVTLERRFIDRETLERRLGAAGAVLGIFGHTSKADRVIPCKVYDGFAAGQAVITADTPATRAALENEFNVLLVDRENPRSLVEALRRVRDDEGLRTTLRAGARRLADAEFSPGEIGARLRERLESYVNP